MYNIYLFQMAQMLHRDFKKTMIKMLKNLESGRNS